MHLSPEAFSTRAQIEMVAHGGTSPFIKMAPAIDVLIRMTIAKALMSISMMQFPSFRMPPVHLETSKWTSDAGVSTIIAPGIPDDT